MRRDWIRTESRLVRPFPSLDDSLKGVRFRLAPDSDFDERTSFDASELGDVCPEFLLNVDRSPLGGEGAVEPEELSLVIRIADVRLRRGEIVLETGLDEAPETWALPADVRDRFSWRTGVDAAVALVLRESRETPRPGEPFLRGHWVARKDFTVRPKAVPQSFPIERWTGEDFVQRGLPKDTAYWIDFVSDDLNQRFENPGEAFRVCLRADVYDTLVAVEDTDRGSAAMTLILTEILAEVVFRGMRELEGSTDLEKGGLLDAALRKIRVATGVDCAALHSYVEKGDFATIRAFAQAATQARRSVAKLARPS